MKMVRVELTRCPKCGATCVVGLDDDFQVFCACCKVSFGIKETREVSDEEFKKLKENADEYFENGGWVAFKP